MRKPIGNSVDEGIWKDFRVLALKKGKIGDALDQALKEWSKKNRRFKP